MRYVQRLIVVESPAKVKTLQKFLGGDYIVKASVGHIKDLPEDDLGVDLEKDFQPVYVPIEGEKQNHTGTEESQQGSSDDLPRPRP
jgi:DNA topoisomerase-1